MMYMYNLLALCYYTLAKQDVFDCSCLTSNCMMMMLQHHDDDEKIEIRSSGLAWAKNLPTTQQQLTDVMAASLPDKMIQDESTKRKKDGKILGRYVPSLRCNVFQDHCCRILIDCCVFVYVWQSNRTAGNKGSNSFLQKSALQIFIVIRHRSSSLGHCQ